jgi:heptosyltransferase-1
MPSLAILVVRLGAMGDIIHTLPAVAALKRGHPESPLVWAVEPKWEPLLELNPFVDRVVLLHRESVAGLVATRRSLLESSYQLAVDFQGLIKSALVAFAANAPRTFGFDAHEIRERTAAILYGQTISSRSVHVVERNLDLAVAAGGIRPNPPVFPLPPGRPEGDLPSGDFVLASPLAGWASKQWPLPHYRALAARLSRELGLPLVLNGAPGAAFGPIDPAVSHGSSLPGLIHATRRAAAVVGVDSGPLHMAAALEKPGVAIFGPTDPARNGPYCHSIRVLRRAGAVTTYKRGEAIDLSMREISPDEVFEALRAVLGERSPSIGCLAG